MPVRATSPLLVAASAAATAAGLLPPPPPQAASVTMQEETAAIVRFRTNGTAVMEFGDFIKSPLLIKWNEVASMHSQCCCRGNRFPRERR